MAPISHLVDSPRPRCVQVQSPPDEPHRVTLASARWRVHVPHQGQVIADTTTAGADLELIGESHGPVSETERCPAERLALTFWIDRGSPDEPQRVVLASFAQHPDLDSEPLSRGASIACFELVDLGDAISLVVSDGMPLLCLTQLRRAPGERPMLWCRSRLHELLGLIGGQYRLEEVRLDLPLVCSVAASSILAREAG